MHPPISEESVIDWGRAIWGRNASCDIYMIIYIFGYMIYGNLFFSKKIKDNPPS